METRKIKPAVFERKLLIVFIVGTWAKCNYLPKNCKKFFSGKYEEKQESRKLNKPFWAFALATAHAHYPVPTMAHLKFQMYSNLAYGAQGLQYFTYWCPSGTPWDFHKAPVEANGKRTAVYDLVRELNQELLIS